MDIETVHQIAGLRAQGRSVRQIAAATDIPPSTVQRNLQRDDAARIIADLRPRILAHLSLKLFDRVADDSWAPSDMILGTLYGIVHDKHTKAEQLDRPSDHRTLVIVIPGLAQPPDPPDTTLTIDA